jgi:hypothetical protein
LAFSASLSCCLRSWFSRRSMASGLVSICISKHV